MTKQPPHTCTIGDLLIQRMGYGSMRLTGEGIWGPPADRQEALRVLRRAVELGINFIDTADSYGPHVAEELIAEALHPYPDDLVIATKGGLTRTGPDEWPVNARPDYLREVLHGSLKRLKLEQIPLYQLHRVDPEVPIESSLEVLRRAQEEGLIRHIGLSEVSVDQIRQAQQVVEVVSVQNKYSIDRRRWEPVVRYCGENNMAFIPWYPLNAGNVDTIARLDAIGKRHDASPHQIALSWLLHHAPHIVLIPGTSRVAHLEENFRAASIQLSEEDVQELDELGIASTSANPR